jgi:hypothetical protein
MILLRPFSKIQTRLQSLLDQPIHSDHAVQTPAQKEISKFVPTTDLTHFPDVLRSLPKNSSQVFELLFSRLSLYFEAGLYLERPNGEPGPLLPKSAFYKGEAVVIGKETPLIQLPKVGFQKVVKFNPHSILSPLNLERLCDEDHGQGLAFSVTEDDLFLLFSELPDLWLRSHIETIHHLILQFSADQL